MKKGWINFHVLKKIQPILIIAACLTICIGAAGQSAEKVRFAFMMVVDK